MPSDTPALPAHIEATVQALAKLHADHHQGSGALIRAIGRLTGWIGRPKFIARITAVGALWVVGNLAAGPANAWDPPPFNWLQGATSLLALYVTLLILTTQSWDDQLAEYREQLGLQLAMLSDQKSAKIIALLEEIRRDSPTLRDRVDERAASMAIPADPQAVLDAIRENANTALSPDTPLSAGPDCALSGEPQPSI